MAAEFLNWESNSFLSEDCAPLLPTSWKRQSPTPQSTWANSSAMLACKHAVSPSINTRKLCHIPSPRYAHQWFCKIGLLQKPTPSRGAAPTHIICCHKVLRLVQQWLHKNRICFAKKKYSTWLYQCLELFPPSNLVSNKAIIQDCAQVTQVASL
jgi:hypothetical protein